jgi:succinate dehydrogenase/fumarate reductase flavoprotein subunit
VTVARLSTVPPACTSAPTTSLYFKEYFWGYNRMTTVRGLFATGDGVGGSAHKFSSGSYTEGRLAGKTAVAYVSDHPAAPNANPERVEAITSELFRILEMHEEAASRHPRRACGGRPSRSLVRVPCSFMAGRLYA